MSKSRQIFASTLVLCWALLLATRAIAAAINYGTMDAFWFLPYCAWASLLSGVLIAFPKLASAIGSWFKGFYNWCANLGVEQQVRIGHPAQEPGSER